MRAIRLIFASVIIYSTVAFPISDLVPFAALVEKIEGNPKKDVTAATTIEAVLEWLPKNYRAHHTYVYERPFSKRLDIQEASFLNPRAIVFGKDGKLILTFNGDSKHQGYNLIELARWRDDTNTLELREIRFSPDGKSKAQISPPNPARCIGCHEKHSRHIWNPYNFWPGIYGSIDDAIIDGTEEKKEFVAFRAAAKSHPRYRTLIESLPTASEFSPYYLEDIDAHPYYRRKKPSPERRIDNMPNLRLNEILIRLNARRVYATLKSSPLFSRYKYLVAALMPMDCDTWGGWLSEKKSKEWVETVAKIETDYSLKFPEKRKEADFSTSYDVKARLLELLDAPFDTDWTLLFRPEPGTLPTLSRDYNEGRFSFASFVSNLLWDDVSLELPKLSQYRYEDALYEKELFRIGLLTTEHRDILRSLGQALNLFPGSIDERIKLNKQACLLVETKILEKLHGNKSR